MKKRKRCAAIIPAAGSSSRMAGTDKLFYEIDGIPIIVITLAALQTSKYIDEIIVSARESDIIEIARLCNDFGITKVSSIVKGGGTRSESVLAGINEAGKRFELLAIHDAARPLVSEEVIEDVIALATKWSAAAPAVPIKDTVKLAENNIVSKTLPRQNLYAIQTPQVFDRNLIFAALSQAVSNNTPVTDDCSAVELLGMKVVLGKGDYENIKITTIEDLLFIEAVLHNRKEEKQ